MKKIFFISFFICLSAFAAESNNVFNCKSNCSSNASFEEELKPKEISPALQNGALRQIADRDNPRTYETEYGKKTVLLSKKGRRTGTVKSYEIADGITKAIVRDRNGKKVGKAKTYNMENGLNKTVLRDENGNKIGSISKAGGHTVYRDANGKRVSRREARKLGLR